MFAAICEALRHAHQRGIVHRDLKPSNILVDANGRPHVLDFGLAKAIDSDLRRSLTGSEFLGTFGCAAPEQLGGDPRAVDTRTDVYALGVILYELLTDRLPYSVDGPLPEVIRAIEIVRPAPPSRIDRTIPRDLDIIVSKALAKEPDRRYDNAAALLDDVRAFLRGDAIRARRDSAWYVLGKLARRHRLAFAFAGGVVILLAFFNLELQVARNELRRSLAASELERYREIGAPYGERRVWQKLLTQPPLDRAASQCPAPLPEYWAFFEILRRSPCLARLPRHPGRRLIGPSPSGEELLILDADGQVLSWDWSSGVVDRLGRVPAPPDNTQSTFALSPQRKALALAQGGSAVIYSLPGLDRLQEVGPVARRRSPLAFSPDGTQLASERRMGRLSIFELATGRVTATAHCDARLKAITFSGEGDRVAAATNDGRLLLFDADGGALGELTLPESAHALRPASGERLLVSQPGTKQSRYSALLCSLDPLAIISYHGDLGGSPGIALSPEGQRVVTRGREEQLEIWDLETNRLVASYAGHRSSLVQIWHLGSQIVSASTDGEMRVWEARSNGSYSLLLENLQSSLHCVAVSPSGDRVAISGEAEPEGPGVAAVLDLDGDALTRLPRQEEVVSSITFTPEGDGVVTAGHDNVARLWSLGEEPQLRLELDHGHRSVNMLDVSPDGHLLATASNGSPDVRLWSLESGEQLAAWDAHEGRVPSLDFDATGRRLVTAGSDRNVSIWEVGTCELIRTLVGHEDQARVVRFSPDGEWVASGGDDRTVRIWDAASGQERFVLRFHPAPVYALAFRRWGEETVLASGDGASRVALWHVETGRRLAELVGPDLIIFRLEFSPDGDHLYVASSSGMVGRWHLRHYERHLAGNLEAQIAAIEEERLNPEAVTAWRRWALTVRDR